MDCSPGMSDFEKIMSTLGLLSALMKREFRRLASRRIYWFILILAPAFCFIFFADLLKQGLPMKLPDSRGG